MLGRCDAIELTGPIERIRISYTQQRLIGITGIEFTRNKRRISYGSIDPLNVKAWDFGPRSKLMGFHGRFDEDTSLITQLGVVESDESIDDSLCFNDALVKLCRQTGTMNLLNDACMNESIDETTSSSKHLTIMIIIGVSVALFLCAILTPFLIRRECKDKNRHKTRVLDEKAAIE